MYLSSLELALFIFFCINATMAVNFSIRFALERKPQMNTNVLVEMVFITSAVWSIGMGLMSVQTTQTGAYICRIVGILGCFVFMMVVQKMLCLISEIPKRYQNILNGIAYTGFLVYLLYINPSQTIFEWTSIGVTFRFAQNWVNAAYVIYFTVVSLNIFNVSLYMLRKHKMQRVRVMGRNFLIVETLIFIGSFSDLLMPSLGYNALPGSAITHFWGVFVFWFAIHGLYRSKITVGNMSEYIYYSLGNPVLVFDSDYKIKVLNDAASNFLKCSGNEVAQKNFEIDSFFDVKEDLFNFEEPSIVRDSVSKANGAPCQLAISKITDTYQDVIGYILIVSDMREHYQAMKKLEQAKLEADAANMSKSVFLANMSHEIRTPMNAILGFSSLALEENIDDKSKGYFTDIKRSGESLLGIINNILSISKIELGTQELSCSNYSTSGIFNDVATIIGVQAKSKGLEFEMNIDQNYPEMLFGDKDKIREILINLLNNAVKYTKSGTVSLEAKVTYPEQDKPMVMYRVSDTGIGIKPEDKDRIFEKFSRMDARINSETEGTGLGLSITKGLVELMKGSINVESEYGLGTVFTVIIPQKVAVIQKEETSAAKNKESLDAKQFEGYKFLAVDDNNINLKVISKIISRYGIVHDLATSGEEAIKLCSENEYNLVLMDQMMPVMDGVEAMKRIRTIPGYETGSDRKIVALTANVIEGVKESLISEGFDDFLGKPIDRNQFERVLRELK